jgi:Helix-turn-helix
MAAQFTFPGAFLQPSAESQRHPSLEFKWLNGGAGAGIGQDYVAAFERGPKEPGATNLFRIARLYGKSIE